jgi:tRNA/tmRNA/rRNA uracil-C5-methylase (TrmA/RlmC/RlmD family)
MARLAQRVIVMLSCDPVTFARDLARLTPLGWEFAGIEAFDMFPQTHHIESMAWLFPR